MALESLAALSLAANVVQFIELGSRTYSGFREIYASGTGTFAAAEQRKELAQDLLSIAKKLQGSTHAQSLSKDEQAVQKLALSCADEAHKLVLILNSLKVDPNNKAFDSLKKTIKAAWKERGIRSLEATLENYKSELALRMLQIMNNKQTQCMKTLSRIDNTFQALHQGGMNSIHASLDTLRQRLDNIATSDLSLLRGSVDVLLEDSQKRIAEQNLLKSLRYHSMSDRFNKIVEAHNRSFDFIFEQWHEETKQSVEFGDWLRTNKSLYWISGKPGSGKSTLMKHIVNSPVTREYLMHWANDCALVIASFFFWYNGSPTQKSLDGLLRSLLFEVLRGVPSLIHPLLAECTDLQQLNTIDDEGPWTGPLLLRCIRSILRQDLRKIKFCLFIDGLDEYVEEANIGSGGGNPTNHADVVEILTSLSANSNVKICVSSREWPEFERIYRTLGDHSLTLQDFTKGSIRSYVCDELERDEEFKHLLHTNVRYSEFVEDFVTIARGVFLWVTLALSNIRKGISKSDDLATLRKRLKEFPPTLDLYFKRMLDQVERVYHTRSSRILLLSLAAVTPLDLMIYSYLDEDRLDGVLAKPSAYVQDCDSDACWDRERAILHACCPDLLDLPKSRAFRIDVTAPKNIGRSRSTCRPVEFVHRVVTDYLLNADVQQLLKERLEGVFEAETFLCHAYLAQMKLVDCGAPEYSNHGLMGDMLEHARNLETINGRTELEALIVADKLVQERLRKLVSARALHHSWTKQRPDQRSPVLEHCIESGIKSFVEKYVMDDRTLFRLPAYGAKLLRLAIEHADENYKGQTERFECAEFPEPWKRHDLELHGHMTFDIIELLLQQGADPNQFDVWPCLLREVYDLNVSWSADDSEQNPAVQLARRNARKLIELLLEYNADPFLMVRVHGNPRRLMSPRQIIEAKFDLEDQAHLLSILNYKSALWSIRRVINVLGLSRWIGPAKTYH